MITTQYKKIFSQLSSRHGRKKSPYFIVEGVRCCLEGIQRRSEWLEAVFCSEEFHLAPPNQRLFAALQQNRILPQIISFKELAEYGDTDTNAGILCLMRRPEKQLPALLPSGFCFILDQVREPGNLGTILRTAWAVGLKSVWLTAGCADVYSSKVVRAGMGAQFALQLNILPELSETVALFKKLGGRQIWCTLPDRGISVYSKEFNLEGSALIIGNEANGISAPAVGDAVTIPMPGHAESLNAAQAATIFLFEGVRRNILK